MNSHGGQDGLGFVIVMGILVVTLLVTWLEGREWFRRADDNLQRIIDEALAPAEPDHVDCSNPDCEQVICACRKPRECTGCSTQGCLHGEGLCWDCRLGCRECLVEERAEQDHSWAAGR